MSAVVRTGRHRALARALRVGLVLAMAALVLYAAPGTATIEEQRARLPPPAPPGTCSNPVEGVWQSLRWYPGNAAWYRFVLEIHQSGLQLTGTIQAQSWDTPPSRPEPGPCHAGLDHFIVMQTAVGAVQGLRIEFGGTRWAVQQVLCGHTPYSYNTDHFRGVIDPSIQEFQSVNNDGGLQIDEPTVFRRVRCFEPDVVPHPYVAPPDFHPPQRRGWGCARQ